MTGRSQQARVGGVCSVRTVRSNVAAARAVGVEAMTFEHLTPRGNWISGPGQMPPTWFSKATQCGMLPITITTHRQGDRHTAQEKPTVYEFAAKLG